MPEGHGLLRMADNRPIHVRYWLIVVQTIDDTGILARHLYVHGTVEIRRDEGAVDLTGKQFQLQTDDGRRLVAAATTGSTITRQWEIISTNGKGLEPFRPPASRPR
jgi:hypothetical protein